MTAHKPHKPHHFHHDTDSVEIDTGTFFMEVVGGGTEAHFYGDKAIDQSGHERRYWVNYPQFPQVSNGTTTWRIKRTDEYMNGETNWVNVYKPGSAVRHFHDVGLQISAPAAAMTHRSTYEVTVGNEIAPRGWVFVATSDAGNRQEYWFWNGSLMNIPNVDDSVDWTLECVVFDTANFPMWRQSHDGADVKTMHVITRK